MINEIRSNGLGSKPAEEVLQFALTNIQQNTSGDYTSVLDTLAMSFETIECLTLDDKTIIMSIIRGALITKGLSQENTDYLVGNILNVIKNHPHYNLLSAHDILTKEFPEPPWVIPNILRVGLSGLAGKQKIGKSWLALQFACAVAHGGKIFDMKVDCASVLYVATEDPPWRLKDRMKKQGWDINNRQADFMTLGEFQNHIGDLSKNGAGVLAELIILREYRLVIIDTFSRTFSGDQNDVEKMTKALSPLHKVAHDLQASILIIDHHHKGITDQRDPLNDILGSTAKGAIIDTALGLYRERGKNEAELHICGRDVEDKVINLKMDWSIGTWQKIGDDKVPVLPKGQKSIIDFLQSEGEADLKSICDGIGTDYNKGRGTVSKNIKECISKGLVEEFQDGKYKLTNKITMIHDNGATTQQ